MIHIELKHGLVAVIDDEDAWVVTQYSLVADRRDGTWYVRAQKKGIGAAKEPKLYLHRVLTNAPPGVDVDHWDGNGLNNTRINIRIATRSENSLNKGKLPSNTSGYKGAFFNRERNKWFAKVRFQGKEKKRGYFATAAEAGAAYDQLVMEIAPRFGQTNAGNAGEFAGKSSGKPAKTG